LNRILCVVHPETPCIFNEVVWLLCLSFCRKLWFFHPGLCHFDLPCWTQHFWWAWRVNILHCLGSPPSPKRTRHWWSNLLRNVSSVMSPNAEWGCNTTSTTLHSKPIARPALFRLLSNITTFGHPEKRRFISEAWDTKSTSGTENMLRISFAFFSENYFLLMYDDVLLWTNQSFSMKIATIVQSSRCCWELSHLSTPKACWMLLLHRARSISQNHWPRFYWTAGHCHLMDGLWQRIEAMVAWITLWFFL